MSVATTATAAKPRELFAVYNSQSGVIAHNSARHEQTLLVCMGNTVLRCRQSPKGSKLQIDGFAVGWAGVLVGQRIVLHCDDNPDEALLLQRALQRSGLADWVVESVGSGPEA